MLSLIFSLLTFLTSSFSHEVHSHTTILDQDSVKRPRHAIADSTGRFLKVNRIFILGNKRTRDRIILRELSLKQDDIVYSTDLQEAFDRDKRKLINTKLFNTVEIKMLELEPGKIDLLINVTERWYTFPAPIFELSDRNFNEWWQNYNHDFKRVNYGLRLYQFNMRGRNETLRLMAQFGFVRRFELLYRIPYIDKKQKHGLVFDFDYSETRNLAYRTFEHKLQYLEGKNILRTTRGGGITYTFRNSFYESHGIRLEYRNNSIGDTILFLNPNYLGNEQKQQKFGALSYTFTSDHRDYIGYPLKGYYLNTGLIKNGLTSQDDLNKWEATSNFAMFFDLKKNFYLSNNIVGYWSNPKSVPYYNYGAMGYRKQLVRGYEVYVIEGPYYFLNKTTFKKKIFGRTYHWKAMPISQFRHIPLSLYFKVYADMGYVRNYPNYNLNTQLSDKLLSGLGAGFDLIGSYDAVFRFEYTRNGEGQHGFFFHIKKEF